MELLKQSSNQQSAALAANSGRRLLNAGDLDGAISQFRAAIDEAPSYPQAHYQLGMALQRKGDNEGAAEEFKKAAALDPRLTVPSP
jgi:Flp pilus assembly protein TadD